MGSVRLIRSEQPMNEYRTKPLAHFARRFRRSPVRWIVLAHALLLGTLISMLTAFPKQNVLWLIDLSLVTAQVALLLIWLTLGGKRVSTARRMLGVTGVLALIHIAHAPAVRGLQWMSSLVCMVPGVFPLVGVLALPLAVAESSGYQIERFSRRSLPPPRRMQFSMRYILITTACVAVLFGLKGLAASLEETPESIARGIVAPLALFGMILALSAIYLSIPLVAVWAFLTPGRILPRLTAAFIGWGMGVMLVFHYAQEEGSIPTIIPASVIVCAIPILLGTLLVLRQMGYRAVWGGRDVWILFDDLESRTLREKVTGRNQDK